MLVGSLTLFFIDLHRWNLARHKHTRANGTQHLCVSETCPQRRRLSFSQEPDNNDPGGGNVAASMVAGTLADPAAGVPRPVELLGGAGNLLLAAGDKPELTCISEEGIADMDLPDNLLDDLDYIGDCITSCNKVMHMHVVDCVTCVVTTLHCVITNTLVCDRNTLNIVSGYTVVTSVMAVITPLCLQAVDWVGNTVMINELTVATAARFQIK